MTDEQIRSLSEREAINQAVAEIELEVARLAAARGRATAEEKQRLKDAGEIGADDVDDLDTLAKYLTPSDSGTHS